MTIPSATCAECRTLIGGYVLDALEPDETATVRRHLASCPDCAAEYDRLADIPALLALTSENEAAAERPPAALEEAVLDRFALEHRRDGAVAEEAATPRRERRRLRDLLLPIRRPLPAAAAGALAAAAVAAVLVLAMGGEDSETGHVYAARLDGLSSEPSAHAYAKLQTSSSGTRVWLHVKGLSGNPSDTYELWCVKDDGTKVSAGTFRVDASGQAAVNLTTAAVPGEYHLMNVEERESGSPRPGERVMAGSIQY